MLGSAMVKELSSFDLIAPSRSEYEAPDSIDRFILTEGDVVINCIGVIPQKKPTVEKLEKINGDFPHLLATRKDLTSFRLQLTACLQATRVSIPKTPSETLPTPTD